MARADSRIRSGQRDRLVTIQQRSATDTPDPDSGEPVETWTTLVENMPAEKVSVTGDERFQADQVRAHYDTVWRMNYRADMDPELVDVPKLRRLIVQSRPHDIVVAVEIGRRAGIELMTLAASGS
jgi:hypothetical protein